MQKIKSGGIKTCYCFVAIFCNSQKVSGYGLLIFKKPVGLERTPALKKCPGDKSSAGKESTCNAGDLGSISGWKDPLEKGKATYSSKREWQSTPVFLLGEFHGYIPWDFKKSDMTE